MAVSYTHLDISFDAGGKVIIFGEHQSTVNENMPLRSLLYICLLYTSKSGYKLFTGSLLAEVTRENTTAIILEISPTLNKKIPKTSPINTPVHLSLIHI